MGRELLAPATWANQASHGIAADINSGKLQQDVMQGAVAAADAKSATSVNIWVAT